MPRAFVARLSTVHLIADIKTLRGIDRVLVIPRRQGTLLRVYSGRDGWGKPIFTDFSLAQAREWLASEQAAVSETAIFARETQRIRDYDDGIIADDDH